MRLTIMLLIVLFFFGSPSCASTVQLSDTVSDMKVPKQRAPVPVAIPEPPPIKVSSLVYDDYSEPINKVKKRFLREQALYSKTSPGQYYFRIFPVSMYPFFCLSKKDTISPEKYRTIFSEGYYTNIGAYLDRFSMDHVQIAVLQYIKLRSLQPWNRTYILFSFRKNYATKEWEPERAPLIVSMYYNASTESYYAK